MYVYTSINLRNNITFYYKFSAYRRIRRKSPIQNATHRRAVKKLVVVSKRIEKVWWSSFCGFSLYITRTQRGATRRDTTRFLSTVLFTVDRIVVVDKQIYHSYILMYKRNLYRVQTLLFRVDFIQRKMFFFLSSSRLRPEIRGNTRNY